MATEIIYLNPIHPGYQCFVYMARLAAELFEADLVVLQPRSLTYLEKALAILPQKKGGVSGILICPSPADLQSILLVSNWRKRYDCLVAWVFDSFWPEHIPSVVRLTRIFDHVYVTEQEDLDVWRGTIKSAVDWLPWGSDTLRIGSANPVRPIDLLRFGRQPAEWDDDASTASISNSKQLRFEGRPPYVEDASEGQRALMAVLRQAKFTLSFSNLVSPGVQTHPKRAYITGRWTDALSAGAIVAGVPPDSVSVRALLWEGSLLDLQTVNRNEGIEVLTCAARAWKPYRAHLNYLRSLEVLDWRWRFEKLASAVGARPSALRAELNLLRQAIDDCGRFLMTQTRNGVV